MCWKISYIKNLLYLQNPLFHHRMWHASPCPAPRHPEEHHDQQILIWYPAKVSDPIIVKSLSGPLKWSHPSSQDTDYLIRTLKLCYGILQKFQILFVGGPLKWSHPSNQDTLTGSKGGRSRWSPHIDFWHILLSIMVKNRMLETPNPMSHSSLDKVALPLLQHHCRHGIWNSTLQKRNEEA